MEYTSSKIDKDSLFQKKTVILVIHGIGQQKPLDTLDDFSRGFIKTLQNDEQLRDNFEVSHRIKPHPTQKDGVKNYMRFQAKKNQEDVKGKGFIDVHEYYWANLTEKKAGLLDIQNWLKRTIAGSRKSFRYIQHKIAEEQKIVKNNPQMQLQCDYWEMKEGKMEVKAMYKDSEDYLFKLSQLLSWWLWLQIWTRSIYQTIQKNLPALGSMLEFLLRPLINYVRNRAEMFIMDYIGDVTVYTTIDDKSEHYNIRQKILSGAVENILLLLEEEEYEQVVVMGHSLGSVIAYDALSRVNVMTNLNQNIYQKAKAKLKGLITFGSPLDKIYFFFREMSDEQDYIRRQLTSNAYSFKASDAYKEDIKAFSAKMTSIAEKPIMIDNTIQRNLEHITWLNYHHSNDPVSGHLDFYTGLDNIECLFEDKNANRWGFQAHLGYWMHDTIYIDLGNKIIA